MSKRKGVVTVRNTKTGRTAVYALSPRRAVTAAYAQLDCSDFDYLAYEKRYGGKVKGQGLQVSCGDWVVQT